MSRRAIVVGLGDTGLSCVSYLQSAGYQVEVCDSRSSPPLTAALKARHPDVPLILGPFRADVLMHADLLAVSPGVALREPAIRAAIRNEVAVVGDIELFARACQAPIIAVTGSNGKSTVTSMVGEMLQRAGLAVEVGGNIGVPALTLLARPIPDVYVLELSSFQLETTSSLNAQAATVLNVTPDHMDRYEDFTEYAHAKARVYGGTGRMVVNREDPAVMAMAHAHREVVSFGLDRPTGHDFGLVESGGQTWLAHGKTPLMTADALALPGRHNIANALAALALATTMTRATDTLTAALREFRGLKHRTQRIAQVDGVEWIDDSKGTNVGATLAAVSGLPGPVVLIAGGDGKGADFTPLAPVMRVKARALIVIGRDGPRLAQALDGCCPQFAARDMDEAVTLARAQARPGDQVLLSPACASFDMFRDYAHRGEVFTEAVTRLVMKRQGGAHG